MHETVAEWIERGPLNPPEGATVHYSRDFSAPACGVEWIPGEVWCSHKVSLVTCAACLRAEIERASLAIRQTTFDETVAIDRAIHRLAVLGRYGINTDLSVELKRVEDERDTLCKLVEKIIGPHIHYEGRTAQCPRCRWEDALASRDGTPRNDAAG